MKAAIIKVIRTVRIFSSIVFVSIAILFIVLGIRSYRYSDYCLISWWPNQHVVYSGGFGRMCVWFEHSAATNWFFWEPRPFLKEEIKPVAPEERIPIFDIVPFWPGMTRLYAAHWFLTVTALTLALAPWMWRRFTLRDALVVITVICVLTATISWLDTRFP